MKHTLQITLFLVVIFFVAQIVGLGIVNQYIDHKTTTETGKTTFQPLPFNVTRPEVEQGTSYIYVFLAVLIGTGLVFLLIKFGQVSIWKTWFFASVLVCLVIAFSAFLPEWIALGFAILLSVWKVYRPNVYVHNLTEPFVYGGIAAIFVPIMNVFSAVVLLILISFYDMYAVWKSKHMVELAKWQTKSNIFAGLFIPYKLPEKIPKGAPVKKKMVRTAILGGGDIAFPLIFSGVVMKDLMLQLPVFIGFLETLIISLTATIALFLLLMKADKEKFYPAMPFLTLGCAAGTIIVWLINLGIFGANLI